MGADKALMVAAALMLGGCASASYVMSEYGGIDPVPFDGGTDIYRVFDKPAANKVMITPSIARAMGAGAASGLTFGAVPISDNVGPKPEYERVAIAYLKSTGRECRILDGYLVITAQWEFKYDCSVPNLVQRAPMPTTRR
jgi:hypothetical protein